MDGGAKTPQEAVLQEMVTLHHRLSNQLTVAAGRAQLLSADPAVPPAMRADAARIVDAAREAASTGHRLQELAARAQRRTP